MTTEIDKIKLNAEAEAAMVRLAILMAKGESESEQAFELRDQLALLEMNMDENAVQFMKDLSSDLYSLEDDEIYDDASPQFADKSALGCALYETYQNKLWAELLVLLRQDSPMLSAPYRAYLRGRAYGEVGHFAAAWAFYSYAAQLNDNIVYRYAALHVLSKWNMTSALSEAQNNLASRKAHPALQIFSANILLSSYRQDIEDRTKEVKLLASSIIDIMGRASENNDIPVDVLNAGYVALASCLELLQDYANAAFVFRLVARSDNDALIKQQITSLDEIVNSGLSVDSGILINPIKSFNPDERAHEFDDVLRPELERELLASA